MDLATRSRRCDDSGGTGEAGSPETSRQQRPAALPTVAVAFSGGRDSTALLHCSLRRAGELGLSVLALHVNHGLMPQAEDWERSVRRRCADWARRGAPLRLVCERIEERPAAGESVEAWARRMRYAALRRMALAEGCDTVLLAHHRGDQAETFLLQALRGAGVAGIAAMPAALHRDGVHWLRPWIVQPRAAIDAYLARHRLAYIDDGSNADPRFARNRLRLQVWPALLQAFPDAEQSLCAAARWASEAAQCLHELAKTDLADVSGDGGDLALERWLSLSPARRGNVLRAWLGLHGGRPAPAALVERLLAQWPPSSDRMESPRGGRLWDWDDDRLVDSRGSLRFLAGGATARPATARGGPVHELSIDGPGRYALAAWGGSLIVERVASAGVPLSRLASVVVRARRGAEQFQSGPGRPPRRLKKQFQSAARPAWQRDGPLIFGSDGSLLFVSGLGIDARCIVEQGKDLVTLAWRRDEAG